MTKESSNFSKRDDGISVGDMMFQIITKNTEVMTELCETLKDMEETLDEISKSDIKSNYARDEILNVIKAVKRISIIILIVAISIMIAFALGGKVGWLIEIGTKLLGIF